MLFRIKYNVKYNYSILDIRYFFKKNQKIYLWFLIFFFIGIIAGIFVAVSNDSYLTLLSVKDKNLFDFVNGDINYSKQVVRLIIKNFVFEILIFVLCLNFYSGLISFFLVSYQSAILFLTIVAMISEFGFSGIMIVLFLGLPVNIVLFLLNIIFAGFCFSRSVNARRLKMFSYGFNHNEFWLALIVLVFIVIVFSCLINLLFLLILRSRIFILF